MREIPCHQVDAFSARPFRGNPAAVCPLGEWLPTPLMQAIAAENALSETAFFVPRPDGGFDLRWFTPEVEVDLCGHATLASAHVLFALLEPGRSHVRFHTRSGALSVERAGDRLRMELPSRPPVPDPDAAVADAVAAAIGRRPTEVLRARDLVAMLDRAEDVRTLAPDFAAVAALPTFALIVTAPGTGRDADVHFVSRFFTPQKGIAEDPVTGSAHCTLTPLWAARLGTSVLRARQVSARQGELGCELVGDRVHLTGQATLVKTGTLLLPDDLDV